MSKIITTKKGTTEGTGSEFATITTTTSSSSLKSVSTEPTAELQADFGLKHSPRSLAQQLKSSIMRISPVKLDKYKNNGSFAKPSKGIESFPSMDEIKSGDSYSTNITTTNSIKDEEEKKREEEQVFSEIEPNLESLSTEDNNNIQSSDSNKTENINIDAKEIDKIQSDILKTLKRLEDS